MLKVKLVDSNAEQPKSHRIKRRKHLIGRHSSCDLILEDSSVSRLHCVIMCHDQQVLIMDLGSRSRTYVNGTRLGLAEMAAVQDGDQIRLGKCEFQISIRDPETGAPMGCRQRYLADLPFPFVQLEGRRSHETVLESQVDYSPSSPTRSDAVSKTTVSSVRESSQVEEDVEGVDADFVADGRLESELPESDSDELESVDHVEERETPDHGTGADGQLEPGKNHAEEPEAKRAPGQKTPTQRYLDKVGSKSAAQEALDKMFPGSKGK